MNAAQIHLMTAHLPVIGLPFAAVLLTVGLVRKSETLWRAGASALLATAALTAIPYFSGPPAYEFVGERYSVAKEPVERHAVVARAFSLGLVVLGCAAVADLLRGLGGDPPSRWLRIAILAGAAVIAYGFAWSAHLGGLVRHPELADPHLPVFPASGQSDADQGIDRASSG